MKARKILRNSYLSRHAAEHVGGEKANVYFDEAMIDKPEAAWEALLKEVLKGDSKKVWHGVVLNNGLDQILRANVFLPEVDATREYWNPTVLKNRQH